MLTSNDDLELVTVLASVSRSVASNVNSPSDTLDVGERRRVRTAVRVWSKGWVTLEVDVEGLALRVLVAVACTSDGVVAAQGLVAQIGNSLAGALEVAERARVAFRSFGTVCRIYEWLVGVEGGRRVIRAGSMSVQGLIEVLYILT